MVRGVAAIGNTLLILIPRHILIPGVEGMSFQEPHVDAPLCFQLLVRIQSETRILLYNTGISEHACQLVPTQRLTSYRPSLGGRRRILIEVVMAYDVLDPRVKI